MSAKSNAGILPLAFIVRGSMNRIGVDLIEISRIERAVTSWGEHFLRHIYTRAELELCRGRAESLAARFAAKEAVMKALGCGFKGVPWLEIEVLSSTGGEPVVALSGRARQRADSLGIRTVLVSLSHSGDHAIAYVLTS